MNIWRIIIVICIVGLLCVGVFSKTTWDIKLISFLYAIANTVIYRGLIFNT